MSMRKIWKDGRVKVELDNEEKERVNAVFEKDVPSNREIVELLKMIIEILIS